MKWKFSHGKFRPLMKQILQNDDADVQAASRAAFALLASKTDTATIIKAIESLSGALRGVRMYPPP